MMQRVGMAMRQAVSAHALARAAPVFGCKPSAAFVSPARRDVLGTYWSRGLRSSTPIQMGRRSAKIAGRKGKADAKKAKLYGKIGKKIIQIVKAGGGDPATNARLHDQLRQARDLGVPKDILDRNIKKASDAKQADFAELVYEAYGPGGTGFIVDVLTDNVNRSAGDVKAAITKAGGKPAEPGSVMFSFVRQGQVLVTGSPDEDLLFEAAMDAGADDLAPVLDDDGAPTGDVRVFTTVDQFGASIEALRAAGFTVDAENSELIYRGAAEVEVDDDAFAKCEAMVERLLELDDVDAVYTNCEGL